MILSGCEKDQKAHESILKTFNLQGFVWQNHSCFGVTLTPTPQKESLSCCVIALAFWEFIDSCGRLRLYGFEAYIAAGAKEIAISRSTSESNINCSVEESLAHYKELLVLLKNSLLYSKKIIKGTLYSFKL